MTTKFDHRMKQAVKLMDELKNVKALKTIKNIENTITLTEEENLSLTVLRLHILISMGNYEEALQLTQNYLENIDLSTLTSNIFRLKQLDVLSLKANILTRLGRLEESKETIVKAESVLTQSSIDDPVFLRIKGDLRRQRGYLYYYQGELNQSADMFQQSLALYLKIDSFKEIVLTHNFLGIIYRSMGALDLSFKHLSACVSIANKINEKIQMNHALSNLGNLHLLRGELDLALKNLLECEKNYKALGDNYNLALIYDDLGKLFKLKGEVDKALKYYEMSLKLRMNLGSRLKISKSLYNLAILMLENNQHVKAQTYLSQLQEVYEREKNELIDQRFRLINALMLGKNRSVDDFANAQKILKEILGEELVDSEISEFALINLCKLLFDELQLFGTKSIIPELKLYIEKLFKMAKDQNSLILLTESSILQSRIALIELDIIKAKDLLGKASQMVNEKKIDKFSSAIESEQALLLKKIENWEKYFERDVYLIEKVELAQLEEIITRDINAKTSKIAEQKEELSKFANFLASNLRNSILEIISFSEDILEDKFDPLLIENILKKSQDMIDILNHSVEIADSSLDVDSVEEVNLSNLIKNHEIQEIIKDVTLIHNKLPILICNRDKMEKIFKYLFENAITYGRITKTISVKRLDHDHGIDIVISHDGVHIPFEKRNAIFQFNDTTKEDGFDIGLTIVKNLVKAHGWKITLEPSEKTTFKISIGPHIDRSQ